MKLLGPVLALFALFCRPALADPPISGPDIRPSDAAQVVMVGPDPNVREQAAMWSGTDGRAFGVLALASLASRSGPDASSSTVNPRSAQTPSVTNRFAATQLGDPACALAQFGTSVDATACIQAAAASRCGASTFELPAGTYKVTSIDFCAGVTVRGAGRGFGNSDTGTRIICAGSPNPCLRWNHGNTNYADGGGISDLSIDASAQTAPVLETSGMRNWVAERIDFYKPTTAWSVAGGQAQMLRDSHFEGVKALAGTVGLIDIDSIGGSSCVGASNPQGCRSDAITLKNLDGEMGVTQTGGSCIALHDFVDTVVIDHVRFLNCWDGITTDCNSTALGANLGGCPTFVEATHLEFDFCQHLCGDFVDTPDVWLESAYLHGSGGPDNRNILVVNCSRYCGGSGSTASNLHLTNSRIDGSLGSCVFLVIPDAIITGNQIWNCNTAGHATGAGHAQSAGIEVFPINTAAAMDQGGSIVADNIFCRAFGQVPRAMDAVTLVGATDHMKVHDNLTAGCAGGVKASSGSHNSIHDN